MKSSKPFVASDAIYVNV